MNKKLLVAWGYISEIILAVLLMILVSQIWDIQTISSFIEKTASDFATLFCAVCSAAIFAFLWTLYSKADTDFYHWLDDKGALSVYMRAFNYALIIELLATILLILGRAYPSTPINLIGGFFLIMATINLLTFLKNVTSLVKLQTLYTKKTKE